MSGRQHHYLPQFLQRYFYARKSGDEFYVYAHRKSSSFQPNTGSIGKQRDFYGSPEATKGDDNITLEEGRLADIVSRANAEGESAVKQDELAVLFASLSIRTKKIREALKEAAPRIIAALSKVYDVVREVSREYDEFFADKAQIGRMIDDQIAQRRMDRNQAAKTRVVVRAGIIQAAKGHKEEAIREAKAMFDDLMSKLEVEASSIADTSFLRVFEESAAPDKRVELFKKLNYQIVEAPEGECFILGDCAVVSVQSDGTPKLALGNVDEGLSLSEVWLPISPRRAVVGRVEGFSSALDVSGVNRLSAMLSHEFFITHGPLSEKDSGLPDLIATIEPLLTPDELAAMAA
jgi:hypothetical protein